MGGRLLQFGDESLSDEVAGCVANRLAQGAAAGDGPRAPGRRPPAAAASGRRKREAAAGRGESLERRRARDADARGERKTLVGEVGKWGRRGEGV